MSPNLARRRDLKVHPTSESSPEEVGPPWTADVLEKASKQWRLSNFPSYQALDCVSILEPRDGHRTLTGTVLAE
jgi:hypothetical protein